MEKSQQQQQVYFDRVAEEFDGHYAAEKPNLFTAIVDRIFRQGMVQRFQYLMNQVDWTGHSVLDVGCGPGRYMAAILGKGARHILGIDFAAAMIDLARQNLRSWKIPDQQYDLQLGDFLTGKFDRTFDTVLAIGYYDYILGTAALDQHFRRMLELADKRVIASFPYRWSFKTLPRWIWLSMRRCPVQFFSVGDVTAMTKRLAIPKHKIARMSGTILLIAEKS
jgi:SAM-dependent methyltransferase